MSKRIALSTIIIVSLIMAVNIPISQAQITSNKPPKLTYDNIRCGTPSLVLTIAQGLSFETRSIGGNTIIESDLEDADILLLYGLGTPYLTQAEINLILDFLRRGEGLYIIPCEKDGSDPSSYYNILYEIFGFKVSGTRSHLTYPDIKNVTFTHPIMDGVSHIKVNDWQAWYGPHLIQDQPGVANLELITDPVKAVLIAENMPLFLVSTYGDGKIFVDLTNGGINYDDVYDNLRVVRDALIWLKDKTLENFRVVIESNIFESNIFDILTLSNSIISSFKFDKEQKAVSFYTTGLLGTEGSCNITIPKGLMWCDSIEQWIVTVDGNSPTSYHASENDNCTLLCFTYSYSTHKVTITSQYAIPEFPSAIILPLFMLATLLAVTVYRRKHFM